MTSTSIPAFSLPCCIFTVNSFGAGGSVSVVTGNSMLGTDFFVKNTDLELATKIVESLNEDELPEEVDGKEAGGEEDNE